MTNEMTTYQHFPTSDELKNLGLIATTAQKSGLYGGSADKILMTLLSARELNIGPMMALNGGIFNINGKVELSARLMTMLIRRAGHNLIIKGDASSCTITGKRTDNSDVADVTFTMEDAAKAGLLTNPSWKKYPEDMLYARAISRLARRLFPDVIGNCYVEGEIDVKKSVEPHPENLPLAEAEPVVNIEELTQQIHKHFIKEDAPLLNEFLNKWTQAHQITLGETLSTFVVDIDRLKRLFNQYIEKLNSVNNEK